MAPTKYNGFTINGINLGRIFFSPEKIHSTIEYEAKADDVFIVGFPKSGTTWMQQIVYLLQSDGKAPANYLELDKKSFFMDITGTDILSDMERPLSIKSHLPSDLTPYNPHAKYIYVARNPFDVCVSFYHFIGSKYGVTDFDEWFDMFMDPKEAVYGDYFDNLLSWWRRRNNSNVLFITYEEMHKANTEAILRIAHFLDYRLAEKLRMSENGFMKRVLQYSSFDHMKKTIDESFGLWHCDEFRLRRDRDEIINLCRKGEVNGGKKTFNNKQIAKMKQNFLAKCGGSGIENLWPDIMS